jgi:hypothetical protein
VWARDAPGLSSALSQLEAAVEYGDAPPPELQLVLKEIN